MNTEAFYIMPTYMFTPTVAYSPSKLEFPPFACSSNLALGICSLLTLDLQEENKYEQAITTQILFPGKENKESIKKSIIKDKSIDNELNKLRTIILSQVISKDMCRVPEKNIELKDESIDLLSSFDFKGRSLVKCENEIALKDEKVGIYSKVERQHKIRKYKEKLRQWRVVHPLSRKFEGRRRVAFLKTRNNGRFTKAQ